MAMSRLGTIPLFAAFLLLLAGRGAANELDLET
jgi:hypothetical protein